MKKENNSFSEKVVAVIGSNKFFWFVIVLFVLQASWVAISFRSPMLFDEGYHINITRFFIENPSPIVTEQDEKWDQFSDIGRSGSYLYHYMMSFPYRAIDGVLGERAILKIISLRLINVLFFGLGLVAYRKLFREMKIQQVFINVALLFFVLLPMAPYVAAHVNYDNLIFLLTPLFLLMGVRLLQARPRIVDFALFVGLGLFASLVKSAFLPIFAAGFVFVTVWLGLKLRGDTWTYLKGALRKENGWRLHVTIVLLFMLMIPFAYTYGLNLVRYSTPSPACVVTLGEDRCAASAFYSRNKILIESTDLREKVQRPNFVLIWTDQMINYVSWSGAGVNRGQNVSEDPVPQFHTAMALIGLLGAVSAVYAWHSLRRNLALRFALVVSLFYAFVVFLNNYASYDRYHQLIATQPRYYLIVLPIWAVLMVLGLNFVLKNWRTAKIVLLFVFLVLFSKGAGIVTHITVSDPGWYWPHDGLIRSNMIIKEAVEDHILNKD
jgi:hypothetical protein